MEAVSQVLLKSKQENEDLTSQLSTANERLQTLTEEHQDYVKQHDSQINHFKEKEQLLELQLKEINVRVAKTSEKYNQMVRERDTSQVQADGLKKQVQQLNEQLAAVRETSDSSSKEAQIQLDQLKKQCAEHSSAVESMNLQLSAANLMVDKVMIKLREFLKA